MMDEDRYTEMVELFPEVVNHIKYVEDQARREGRKEFAQEMNELILSLGLEETTHFKISTKLGEELSEVKNDG